MSCEFDKVLLAAHYDGETTAAERAEVERHLATCPECARDLASMKDLSAALKPLSRATAPMSIAEGVLKEIAPARAPFRSWVRWGASAAAALLLAVGTIYLLDQNKPAPDRIALTSERREAASKPAETRSLQDAEARSALLKKSAAAPTADPAPPAAPAPKAEEPGRMGLDDEGRGEEKTKEDSAQGARVAAKAAVPAIPVVRVKAADVAAARAVVESFLAEREIKLVPGAPLLGRSAFVRDHYLQLDLTAEEAALLDKRIAELKDTSIARTTLDVEKKRVTEELARLSPSNEALGGAKAADADASKDKAGELEEKADRARGAAKPEKDRKQPARPVRVIYVFEAVEARR